MIFVTTWLACSAAPGWLDPPDPLPDARCRRPGTATEPLGRLPIRIRVGRGLQWADAAFHTRWAADTWRHLGVTLTIAADAVPTADTVVFGDDVGDSVLAPVRAHLDRPVRPWIDVVFVSRLADPDSPAARRFDPLVGFAVADPDDPWLGPVVRGATPAVFVGLEAAADLPRERARYVLAHELGHALGLGHRSERGNLMGPGFPRCLPRLDSAQRDRIRARSRRGGPPG